MQGIAGVGFLHVDLPVIHEFFSWLGLMLPSLRLRQLTPIFLLCASSIFALATFVYLRSKEDEGDDGTYLTWAEALEWHLGQCKGEIGNSEEERERMTKLTNLVIRRLINVDHVLMFMGDASDDADEQQRKIAVHPNYVA